MSWHPITEGGEGRLGRARQKEGCYEGLGEDEGCTLSAVVPLGELIGLETYTQTNTHMYVPYNFSSVL